MPKPIDILPRIPAGVVKELSLFNNKNPNNSVRNNTSIDCSSIFSISLSHMLVNESIVYYTQKPIFIGKILPNIS